VEVVPAERGQVEGEVRARGHPAAAAGRGRLDVVAGAQLAAAAGDQLEALRRVQLLSGKLVLVAVLAVVGARECTGGEAGQRQGDQDPEERHVVPPVWLWRKDRRRPPMPMRSRRRGCTPVPSAWSPHGCANPIRAAGTASPPPPAPLPGRQVQCWRSSASSTAIRTATPLATWRSTSDCGPSATSSLISTPRFIGPGCRTTASGAARRRRAAVRP